MSSSAYEIHFHKTGSASVQDGTISVVPINTNWNDFSYNFRAVIDIRSADGNRTFSSAAFVLPLINGKPHKSLVTWINGLGLAGRLPAAESDFPPPFLTLLASESSYSKLASTFPDSTERNAILFALNDIVAARCLQRFPDGAAAITNSKPFSLGVLRDASAYRAFHRGQRYIFAPARELIADARSKIAVAYTVQQHLEVENLTSEIEQSRNYLLQIEFIESDLIEDRIHCAIGVNGSGKSRMLREVLFEAAKKVDTSGTQVFIENFDSTAAGVVSTMPSFNRVLVFSSDVEDRFPRKTRSDSPFEYYYFNLLDRRQARGDSSLVKSFVGLIREDELLQGEERLAIARKALRGYVDLDQVYIPLNPGSDAISSYVRKHPSGDCWINARGMSHAGEQRRLELTSQVDIERDVAIHTDERWDIPLSSGQRVYLRFILQLLASIDTGSLIVMDEPENHLHPNLVCDMMTLLYQVLRLTKSVALIATHSAYVVREVPTHCVHIFNSNPADSSIDAVGGVYLRTLGASISQLSSAVFGDATITKYHELLVGQLARSGLSVDDLIDRYASLLNTEMLSQIRHRIAQAAQSATSATPGAPGTA